MNSFGQNFRITIFGGSHSESVGVIIEGVKQGIELSAEDFKHDLERRKSGASGTTPRIEPDEPHITSGTANGITTGDPIKIVFYNTNISPKDYNQFRAHPRPSHADLTTTVKHNGQNELSGGGQSSGRMTVGIVAAGVVAKKLLQGTIFHTRITNIGGATNPANFDGVISDAVSRGDSVGGIIETTATGVHRGTGEPFFDSVESVASHLLFSIPGIKGVEFGAGFGVANKRGSENNDPITDSAGTTASNNDGGINGGIANGNPIIVRVAVKPTASISSPQMTYNFNSGKMEPLTIKGRHDACIALRAAVVVEAALAIALADLYSR